MYYTNNVCIIQIMHVCIQITQLFRRVGVLLTVIGARVVRELAHSNRCDPLP